jgi:hypothetical protein
LLLAKKLGLDRRCLPLPSAGPPFLDAFYFAFGGDDFHIILDLPSNVDKTAVTLIANASGTVKSQITVHVRGRARKHLWGGRQTGCAAASGYGKNHAKRSAPDLADLTSEQIRPRSYAEGICTCSICLLAKNLHVQFQRIGCLRC